MCFIREIEHVVDGQLLRPADVIEAVHEAAVLPFPLPPSERPGFQQLSKINQNLTMK